jgi:hypothetical protein
MTDDDVKRARKVSRVEVKITADEKCLRCGGRGLRWLRKAFHSAPEWQLCECVRPAPHTDAGAPAMTARDDRGRR